MSIWKNVSAFFTLFLLLSTLLYASAPPSTFTQKSNQDAQQAYPFSDSEDFVNAKQNLIDKPEHLTILNSQGQIVWDMKQYEFENTDQFFDTINPSLHRQAKLNNQYGLFRVSEHVYQVRGYDLSVMSIILGDTGYIVVDPLISKETARAAMQLVRKNLGNHSVNTVIYTHSHIDHFGGVKGIVEESDVKAGRVKIIAPLGFTQAAISENVMAGNAMSRRAMYMYGSLLEHSPTGVVDSGLGKQASLGMPTLIEPTVLIEKSTTEMTIDGRKFIFQYTPDTEAPAEMNFYLPEDKALCMAENATHTLHNLYTLRGAQVRDATSWVKFLNESITLFGREVEVEFASHHWPMWGNAKINEFLRSQRDLYKYIHDQTLRLANQGYNMTEIAERIKLPKNLATKWYNQGYYGTLNHDVKAVYQRYLGWFDGNPANLHPLPATDGSRQYVKYMGGEKAILTKAKKDYTEGNYRWVAEVLNHVIFANPTNKDAKNLLADTYDQLAYQAQSGPWRNFYLTGAQELRHGVQKQNAIKTVSPDIIQTMQLDMFFDYLAIHVNGERADGKNYIINWYFPDTKQKYATILENAVLHHEPSHRKNANASITLDKSALTQIMLGQASVAAVKKAGALKVTGNEKDIHAFLGLLDAFNPWFNIVTPNK